jgi:phosphatidylglycerol:prolipoprotein diacylglycerol transferase
MFSFHLYGLIIGLSISLAIYTIEYQTKRHSLESAAIWSIIIWATIGGVLGARTYHVITDWQYYQNNWLDILKIWQGGLGIIGAVAGGWVGSFLYFKLIKKDTALMWKWLDIAVFGLPFAQALGRWGNFVNQELYGLPTNLPWGIYIEERFRLPTYLNFGKFHPLFAYESILMLLFGVFVWLVDKNKNISLGSGNLFLIYIFYYALIRFWLEFLRVDKVEILVGLDINQLVVLSILLISGLIIFDRSRKEIFHLQ